MNHNEKNIAIIYLGDFFYDARCINMASSLLKEGFSISIIHNSLIDNSIPSIFHGLQFYNTKIKKNSFLFYWKFYSKVRQILKKNGFDILIAGDLYSLANICNYKNKAYLIYDCREIYFELSVHNKKPIKKYLSYLYENYFIKFIDSVLVTAKTDLDFLKSKYVKHQHIKWYIIYNFPSSIKQNKIINIKNKYDIPENQKLIVYQGVIQYNRGISMLIKLINTSDSFSAIIIGDGPALNQYKTIVSQKSLENKVFFLGKIPYLNMLAYTACCDIGWLMIKSVGISNQFALPNKLFEYTLMGLPVVASKLPNIEPIIKKNNFGLCVNEKDANQQLQASKQINENYENYKFVSQKTLSSYIWERQHDLFIKAITNNES